MFYTILLLILGLIVLIVGAESLVRGAGSLAKKLGIAPLTIGLTIVAFGTSAPELIVNIFSAIEGNTDLALGNVIGSNIANILLILGISAIITPLTVHSTTTWKEIPFALLAVILILVMGNDIILDRTAENILTRTDGLALMSFMIIFMYYVYGISKNKTITEVEEIEIYKMPTAVLLTTGGILGLFLGGKMLVDNAIDLANMAGLSESLIGLTIVAVGTSLPELATSVVAAIKKQSDIAIGNVVGSNIFNIFWILGLTSTIFPIPVSDSSQFDITVTASATLILFLAMFIGKKHALERWQGIIFILLYCGYIGFLIFRG